MYLVQTAPRRSSRNTGETSVTSIEEVLLDERKKKGKRAAEEESEPVEEQEEELTEEERSQVEKALELKSSFKMGKGEWNKILDALEKYKILFIFHSVMILIFCFFSVRIHTKCFILPSMRSRFQTILV